MGRVPMARLVILLPLGAVADLVEDAGEAAQIQVFQAVYMAVVLERLYVKTMDLEVMALFALLDRVASVLSLALVSVHLQL